VVAHVGGGETVGGVRENSRRPVGEQCCAVGPWHGALEKWRPRAVGMALGRFGWVDLGLLGAERTALCTRSGPV
jgi:hypothetical protein